MKLLLRNVNLDGSPGAEKLLDVATLRIGRDAAQDLVLSDFRVSLTHAELSLQKNFLGMGSALRIEARSRLPLYVNGAPVNAADLKPGDEVALGRFSLKVQKPAQGADATLVLKESYGAHEERERRKSELKTSIAQTGWSRRRMAWLLFWLVFIPALILPVLLHLSKGVANDASAATREYNPQKAVDIGVLWNSGPMSSAHSMLVNDCTACHQLPFQQVRDSSCKGCHANTGEHASDIATLSKPPFSEQQCTDCHREHNGGGGPAGHSSGNGIIPIDNKGCTDCHADPSGMPGKKLLAVANWSKSHPEFSLLLARRDEQKGGFKWEEFRQGSPEAKTQVTGIKYPHDIHVSPRGIDAPGGKKVLECSYCHQKADDGVSFKPIEMTPHCAECHRLDFDPIAKDRELPHGKPAEVVQVVRDHYARIALAGGVTERGAPAFMSTRRRPGEALPPALSRAALEWADGRAAVALRDVFERRTCFYCHTVTKQPDNLAAPWAIAPVAPVMSTMHSSIFPHSKHSTETCESCHSSNSSKKSEEVNLPDIKQCRTCHGDTDSMTETPSPCQSCHGYHLHDLAAKPKPTTLVPAVGLPKASEPRS